MKTKNETYKYKILLILLLSSISVLLLSTAYKINGTSCSDVLINFETTSSEAFLTQNDIIETIEKKLSSPLIGRNLNTINLESIEETAEKIPFVKKADAFFDSNNIINVNIVEKRPLVRVINSSNVSYYIDNEANKFEISPNFTLRVVLATGFINNDGLMNTPLSSNIDKAIFKLAAYIDEHQLWKAMIEQIYVEANGDFVLIPKVGDFEVRLGEVADLDLKFKKLKNFYEKEIGINQEIEVVNLKYNNQILCELKQAEQKQ